MSFFDGFADELMKLAGDPLGELDTYMKQKGIKTPKALQSKTKSVVKPIKQKGIKTPKALQSKTKSVVKPIKPAVQPSRKQILGGAQMGVQQVAPGSAQAKAIQRQAKTMKPVESAGAAGRRQARETYLRNKRIMEQQQQREY